MGNSANFVIILFVCNSVCSYIIKYCTPIVSMYSIACRLWYYYKLTLYCFIKRNLNILNSRSVQFDEYHFFIHHVPAQWRKKMYEPTTDKTSIHTKLYQLIEVLHKFSCVYIWLAWDEKEQCVTGNGFQNGFRNGYLDRKSLIQTMLWKRRVSTKKKKNKQIQKFQNNTTPSINWIKWK